MDFLKKILQVGGSQYIGKVIEMITSILTARILGVDNYGVYIIAFIIPRVIISFGSFGIGPAIVYYYNKNKLQISSIIITFSILGLTLGSIYYFLLYFFIDFLQQHYFHQKVSTDILFIAMYLVPILLVQKFVRHTLRATYRVKEFAFILNVISAFVRLILTILILVILNLALSGVVWVPIFTHTFVTLVVIFALRQDILLGIKKGYIFLNPGDFKNIIVFGLKSHLGGTVQKANDQIAIIIMAGVLSPASVGFYSLAQKLVNSLSGIKDAISTVLSPKIAQNNLDEIRLYFPYMLRTLLFVNLCIGFGIIIAIPLLIPFLYGSSFNPVISVGLILTPGVILFPIALMVMILFSQTGKPLVKGVIRIFGLAINILLIILLITPYGPIGAAIATSTSYIIMFMVSIFMASRYLDLPYKRLLLISKSDIYKVAINTKVILKNYKFGFGLLSKKKIN